MPEEYSMDEGELNGIIEEALKLAEKRGIAGKELTPFLLARIAEVSGGKSLKTSILLVVCELLFCLSLLVLNPDMQMWPW